MTVIRYIAAPCGDDRVFVLIILGLGAWSAPCRARLALNRRDRLSAS